MLTDQERNLLKEAAEVAALNAYAPYSGFRVGASLLANKRIYVGANVENASYGLSLCAERSALAQTVAAGEAKKIRAIAIACIDANKRLGISGQLPCGACRQWMAELVDPDCEILVRGFDRVFALEELMPNAFRLFDP